MNKEELKTQLNKFLKFKERNWKPKTKRNNGYYFGLLVDFLKDRPFDYDSSLDFFNYLSVDKAQSVRRQAETAILAFVRWMYEENIIEKNWSSRIEKTRVERIPRILPGQTEVIELIKEATEPGKFDNVLTRFSKMEHRWCLLFIVTCSGTRNFETRSIRRDEVSISNKQILISKGKTGARTTSISPVPWLVEELQRRVKGRTPEEIHVLHDRQHYKEDYSDLLFVVNEKRLETIMRDVGRRWNGKPLNVHDLRRICLRDLQANGAQEGQIKNVAGHKNLETTLKYLEFNTIGQQKTLKNFSTEARKYRTKEEKEKELLDHALEIGKDIETKHEGDYFVVKMKII